VRSLLLCSMRGDSGENPLRDSAVSPEFDLPGNSCRCPGRNLQYYLRNYPGYYLRDDSQSSSAGCIPMSLPDLASSSPLPRTSVLLCQTWLRAYQHDTPSARRFAEDGFWAAPNLLLPV
jgi:hypothetical protein